MEKLYALLGTIAICILAWLTTRSRDVKPFEILKPLFWLFVMAWLIFNFTPLDRLLKLFNSVFIAFVKSASSGNKFVFGSLAESDGPSGFVLAFQVLTLVIFFSSISALLYKLHVIPYVVKIMGKAFKKILGVSGVEGLAAAGSIFLGIELGLFLKSYLETAKRGEIFLIITLLMATVASTVMGIYTFLLMDYVSNIAGHLLGASLLSVPASVLVCRLMMPADFVEESYDERKSFSTVKTDLKLERIYDDQSVIEVFLSGTEDGVKLAIGIAATLIAIIGLKGVLDTFLIHTINISISQILNFMFKPFAFMLGINPEGRDAVSMLLAVRFTDTEVSAYIKLSEILKNSPGLISDSSRIAITYALCGFSHIPSFGIFAGGLSTIVPGRRKEFVDLSLLALWSSLLATLLTGSVAKLFY